MPCLTRTTTNGVQFPLTKSRHLEEVVYTADEWCLLLNTTYHNHDNCYKHEV